MRRLNSKSHRSLTETGFKRVWAEVQKFLKSLNNNLWLVKLCKGRDHFTFCLGDAHMHAAIAAFTVHQAENPQ